jgi:hypothetical protein
LPHGCTGPSAYCFPVYRLDSTWDQSCASSVSDGGRVLKDHEGGRFNGGANKQTDLVRKASKALLKQVEETRRKYSIEVEGLKAELQLLNQQRARQQRDAEIATVTAAAAKDAAEEATNELERLNAELKKARWELQNVLE